MRPTTSGRTHLTILLVYALLAILLTWPTAAHVAAHLPGDGGDEAVQILADRKRLMQSDKQPVHWMGIYIPLS
jgi:hypothetical protein